MVANIKNTLLPKVSVIVPSYNHQIFIEESINSLLSQDYKGEIEIIIVDDCSTDGTKGVLLKYENKTYENRIIKFFFKEKNLGLNDSIELGVVKSSGELIAVLASDDYVEAKKISRQVSSIQNGGIDGIYGGAVCVDEFGKNSYRTKLNLFEEHFKNGKALDFVMERDSEAPLIQSGLFKKEIFKSAIEIRKKFKSDDWVMIIYMFQNYNIGFEDVVVLFYRQHSGNTFKKYLETFPMRVDVISRVIPIEKQSKAYASVYMSQAVYLFLDTKYALSLKFVACSMAMSLSFRNITNFFKNIFIHHFWDKKGKA